MRKMTFRIWNQNEGKMIYLADEGVDMASFLKANAEGRLMVGTGMKDIDGREIFEEDFVELYNTYKEEHFRGRIKYLESSAEFVIESEQLTRHKRWINYEMRVVGNSFEMPGYLVTSQQN